MDASEAYHNLREQLRSARISLEAGDTVAALKAVEAALVIDPACGAASVLRDRIQLRQRIQSREQLPLGDKSKVVELVKNQNRWEPPSEPSPASARPIISAEGWALFEQRVRARRVERCVRSARTAIAEGRVIDARNTLAEIRELDPACPELESLLVEANAGSYSSRPSGGARFAAAIVFGTMVLASGSWLGRTDVLLSRPIIARTEPPIAPPATPVTEWVRNDESEPALGRSVLRIDTAPVGLKSRDTAVKPVHEPWPSPTMQAERLPRVERPAPVEASPEPAPILPAAPVVVPASLPDAVPVFSSATPPPPIHPIDDEALVGQALQKYRAAYSGLDARLAQAVWPGVDGTALARAFSGLESQELRFSACRVELRGASATAVCRGSATYVPKVGSREPRLEARVWNFALRKSSGGWQIETARAE